MAVLRQAWAENVRPCLVLNKLDRLILELRLTPAEAHAHLQRLVEQCNALMGSLFASERTGDDADVAADLDHDDDGDDDDDADKEAAAEPAQAQAQAQAQEQAGEGSSSSSGGGGGQGDVHAERVFDWSLEDRDDADIYFAPERGNVVFASAVDGWAFRYGAHVHTQRVDM
jgi:ribosome assembly protein 1